MYLSCTYPVPIMYLSCTYPVPIVYLSCTYRVPIMYLSCTYPIPIVYLSYTYRVPIMYLPLDLSSVPTCVLHKNLSHHTLLPGECRMHVALFRPALTLRGQPWYRLIGMLRNLLPALFILTFHFSNLSPFDATLPFTVLCTTKIPSIFPKMSKNSNILLAMFTAWLFSKLEDASLWLSCLREEQN